MDQTLQFGFDRHDKKHLAMLKNVLSQQGIPRWQAAAALYLYLNPTDKQIDEETGMMIETLTAQQANRLLIEENKEFRKELELAGNDFGISKDDNSGRRWGLRMLPGMLQFIELIDPEVLSGTPLERKKSLHKLMEAFPMYRILKRI